MVIVDEAIDLVTESQLDANDMRRLYGLIPDAVRREFAIEMLFLDELKNFFEKAPSITQGNRTSNEMINDGEPMLEVVMFLADAMEASEDVRKRVHEITGPLPPLEISHPERVAPLVCVLTILPSTTRASSTSLQNEDGVWRSVGAP